MVISTPRFKFYYFSQAGWAIELACHLVSVILLVLGENAMQIHLWLVREVFVLLKDI